MRFNFADFVCGMHSSNTTMLYQVFKVFLQISFDGLHKYTICGSESGLDIQSLVDIYHKLNGMELNLRSDFLLPLYQEQQLVQSFLNIIRWNTKHLLLSQDCPSLRYLMKNKTDIIMFPNLACVCQPFPLFHYFSVTI